MEIKAIFFDLDGLLIDSEKIYIRFWNEAISKLGYSIPYNEILKLRSCDSKIANNIIYESTKDINAYSNIRFLRRRLMNDYLKNNTIDLKDNVVDFLEWLQDKPYKRIIVTSSDPKDKMKILEECGIDKYFDDLLSVKDVKHGKPFPDIYQLACQKMGLHPRECIAFEDSPNGVESAYSAGVRVFMVPDLSQPDDSLKMKCTVITSLLDAKKYL